jgi:hypothetical protein
MRQGAQFSDAGPEFVEVTAGATSAMSLIGNVIDRLLPPGTLTASHLL